MNTLRAIAIPLLVVAAAALPAASDPGAQNPTDQAVQIQDTASVQGGPVSSATPGKDSAKLKVEGKNEGQLQETDEDAEDKRIDVLLGLFMEKADPIIQKAKAGNVTPQDLESYSWLQRTFEEDLQNPMARERFRVNTSQFLPKPNPQTQPQNPSPENSKETPVNKAVNEGGEALRNLIWQGHMDFSLGDMRRRPNDPSGYTNYGGDLVAEGKYKEAIPVLERAVRLNSRDSKTYSAYGTAAFHLGDFALARTSAEKALKLDPKNNAAFAVLRLSEGKKATVSLPSVLTGQGGDQEFAMPSRSPVVPSAQSGPGEHAPAGTPSVSPRPQAQMRPEAAQKSSALAKDAAGALAVKDYLRAIEAATRAIEFNDNNAQAWNYRAMAQSKLGRYQEAARDASYALGLAPNSAAALHTRSWALNKMSRFHDGLADAELVLAREPDNAFAYQNKAFALAGLGDRKGMMAALKRSAEIEPRFKARYEAALQVPDNADVLFLFDQDPGPKVAPGEEAPARGSRKSLVFAVVAVGGFLAALAVALAVFPGLRKGMSAPAAGSSSRQDSGAALQDGSFWKKYRQVREVGIGGMGVVYEAEDTSLGRRVAVKKMRDEIRLDRRERERFLQEARTVASLKHPNIVEIYSIVEDGGEVYLVFEFAEGKTLHEVLSSGKPLSFDAGRRVLIDACEAVECAHRNRIVHRDVKPSNIMVTATGGAKVMDFGVARQAKEAATKVATNTVVGTPPYMAPESEQGTVGPQSDVYGLGVVFYEMLSGKLPFAGSGAGMLLNKMNAKFAPLSQSVPGLPPGIDPVMSRVLSPDPDKRYRTAAEFRAAVEALKPA